MHFAALAQTGIFLLAAKPKSKPAPVSYKTILAGTMLSLGMTRLISGMLFGITATDPLTFAGVAALLGTVAFLANYLPARRASKIDPMVALRYE